MTGYDRAAHPVADSPNLIDNDCGSLVCCGVQHRLLQDRVYHKSEEGGSGMVDILSVVIVVVLAWVWWWRTVVR